MNERKKMYNWYLKTSSRFISFMVIFVVVTVLLW